MNSWEQVPSSTCNVIFTRWDSEKTVYWSFVQVLFVFLEILIIREVARVCNVFLYNTSYCTRSCSISLSNCNHRNMKCFTRTADYASLYPSTCVCFESWCLNALEGSFALNLIILVGATYYIKISGGNQMAAGYTSISMTLATFMGILAFQLANVTGIAQYLKTKFPAI